MVVTDRSSRVILKIKGYFLNIKNFSGSDKDIQILFEQGYL